jgi:hypothetical protein
MNSEGSMSRAKSIISRVVSEKIPMAQRWPVAREFKSWIESLSEEDFRTYLDRLRVLTSALSDEEMPQEKGVFIAAKSYPADQIEVRERLGLVGGEATAYYALAVWRSIEAEGLLKQLDRNRPSRTK